MIDAKCPECGEEIRRTWEAARHGIHSNHQLTVKEIIGDWYLQAAQVAGIPLDGVLFVNDSISFMSRSRRTGPDLGDANGRHLTAADVCTAVREYADLYFNNPQEARTALEQWQVRTSEDVGAIIFALVDAKLLKTSPQDTREAFNDVFTFDDLIEGVHRQAEPA